MTTTKQSTFSATLRTTILMASLSGLLVVIGFLIGGASTAAFFLLMAFRSDDHHQAVDLQRHAPHHDPDGLAIGAAGRDRVPDRRREHGRLLPADGLPI